MQGVFGMHNVSKFEVFCYAMTPDNGSVWHQCISREVEHFKEVLALSTWTPRGLIHADGIHMPINLNGYMRGARTVGSSWRRLSTSRTRTS
jgi:protein O-GlcNAc transferase